MQLYTQKETMLFKDSHVRLKYDRQLEHIWNQSMTQVLTMVPAWLACTSVHLCVCTCVCARVCVHVCMWFRSYFKHIFFY